MVGGRSYSAKAGTDLRGGCSKVGFHPALLDRFRRNSGVYRLLDLDTSSRPSLLPDQEFTKPGEVD